MKTEEEKDEQLIKWLEGDLSNAERAEFEASEAFADYQKIIDHTGQINYPVMDEDAVFSKIKAEIESKTTVRKPSILRLSVRKLVVAAAAIAIAFVAVTFLLNPPVIISAEVGQYKVHQLPDGSQVQMNGKSEVQYAKSFTDNRVLKLKGEAFFQVEEGSSFEVQTSNGTVRVLGTSFNVFARNTLLIVSCKSGKVDVMAGGQSYLLEKGESVKIDQGVSKGKETVDADKIGVWMNGQTYVKSARLEEVILYLSSVYDVQFDIPDAYRDEMFTGSFVHNDLNKALKMVFSPMQLSYSVDEQGKVTLGE